MNSYDITLNIAIFLLFLGLFALGFTIGFKINLDEEITYEVDNITNCSNMSFKETAYCLNSFVSSFYYYNISNVEKDLTFEELKEQGGVCRHYADLYVDMVEELGFNAKTDTFFGEDTGHRIAIAWDNNLTSYCTLDQRDINCVDLK